MTRQYDNWGRDQINIESVQGNVLIHPPPDRSRNEQLLLQEIEREVDSRLAQSLHNHAFITIDKEAQPQQVKRLWDAEVKIGAKPAEPIPSETSILEVFEQPAIAGRLLILGAPGAGKTTTMLDLARALIDKATEEPDEAIPVLFNLSAWKDTRQSMPDWLGDELKSNYGVRKDIGKKWLEEKRLLPMLDGLDEVKSEHQESCVVAINQWLQGDLRPMSIVVCCRREEYGNYQTQLGLNGAILLQALMEEQIRAYLSAVKRTELWQLLQQDTEMLELVKTPLFLSITVLSYEELSLQRWYELTSTRQRIKLLLDAYVQTMFDREFKSGVYGNLKFPRKWQTQQWLSFLGKQLQRESRTEFLIEKMQPTWLLIRRQKRAYRLIVGLFFGLIGGLSGLIGGQSEETMMNYLILGLTIGLDFGRGEEIKLVEIFNWSFEKATYISPRVWLISSLLVWLMLLSRSWLVIVLLLIYVPIFLLINGLISLEVNVKRSPNQGIWRSAINAFTISLIFWLTFWLTFWLAFWLIYGEMGGLRLGLIIGLMSGLWFGGITCIQHFVLRLILSLNGSIPWNYARFLNYCTERLFLQRVGGRYRFIHKLLQDYFAELATEPIPKRE